mgnify:CR=1 FL=1
MRVNTRIQRWIQKLQGRIYNRPITIRVHNQADSYVTIRYIVVDIVQAFLFIQHSRNVSVREILPNKTLRIEHSDCSVEVNEGNIEFVLCNHASVDKNKHNIVCYRTELCVFENNGIINADPFSSVSIFRVNYGEVTARVVEYIYSDVILTPDTITKMKLEEEWIFDKLVIKRIEESLWSITQVARHDRHYVTINHLWLVQDEEDHVLLHLKYIGEEWRRNQNGWAYPY